MVETFLKLICRYYWGHASHLMYTFGNDPFYYNYCDNCNCKLRIVYDHRTGKKAIQEILKFPVDIPKRKGAKNGRL